MKRNTFLIILVILSLFVFVSCQGTEQSETPADTELEEEPIAEETSEEENSEEEPIEEENSEEMVELTLDELSEYDGKDGRRAYVAVDGVIYDVTDLAAWKNGMHNGVTAGKDLTDEIMNQSPHGTSTLSKAEEIGKLVE